MSKRKQRGRDRAAAEPTGVETAAREQTGAEEAAGRSGRERAGAEAAARRGSGRAAPGAGLRGLVGDVVILAAVFAVAAVVAELSGAANLGVALGVGQVAFAVALVLLLALRR